MTGRPRSSFLLFRAAAAVDAWLLGTPTWLRAGLIALTLIVMIATSLPNVPRQYIDFRSTVLGDIQRHDDYGPDSLADMYAARVVVNDPRDMYTKARTEQTPQEAAAWSKEASAPYPPVVLLVEAGLLAIGERTGVGFYGMILGLACVFIALSLWVFLRTRWYLFPLLYLNFDYFSTRLVYVQDNSYVVMLVTVMAALLLAQARSEACHPLMALATTMKLSPLYYIRHLPAMPRPTAALYVAILLAGLVLPYFVFENYLYIYRYGNELKGDAVSTGLALLGAGVFSVVLAYVEVRRGFNLTDRVGWGLVPFAMFLAFKMNVARHLLIVLLVPDRRGLRNVAAALGLALPAALPEVMAFNSSLAVASIVLTLGLVAHLEDIGWMQVREDLRAPGRTLRMIWAGRRFASQEGARDSTEDSDA